MEGESEKGGCQEKGKIETLFAPLSQIWNVLQTKVTSGIEVSAGLSLSTSQLLLQQEVFSRRREAQ